MIYINSHEPKEIIELLSERNEISVKNFTPGDYIIGNIAVERKTINDFLNSLVQKRLFEQLSRLKEHYQNCILLIEAFDLSHFRNTNAIYGAIIKITMDMDIKVIFSQTKEQTSDILYILNKKNEKNVNNNLLKYQLRYKKVNSNLNQKQLQMLESIPNIGNKRAKLLLNRFERIKDIFEADERELLLIKGIGKKTTVNIRKMLETKI